MFVRDLPRRNMTFETFTQVAQLSGGSVDDICGEYFCWTPHHTDTSNERLKEIGESL